MIFSPLFFCFVMTKPLIMISWELNNEKKIKVRKKYVVIAASQCGPTFHGFGVGLAAALTHRVEKLVHLLQRERVVQRLQWVDRRHHGAAFKTCGTDRTEIDTTSPSDRKGGGVVRVQISVHVGCSFSQCGSRWYLLTSHTNFYATVTPTVSALPSTVADTRRHSRWSWQIYQPKYKRANV